MFQDAASASCHIHLAIAPRVDGHAFEGSISRDVRPPSWGRSAGAALIDEFDPAFDAVTCIGHDIANIQRALRGVHGPTDTEYEDWPAFDVFVGYLVLDAWIANTDRHAENWAVLQSPAGDLHLAPSFDHGSALGSGMRQSDFAGRLDRSSVPEWARRGRAGRFDGYRRRTLLELAADALACAGSRAQRHWLAAIASVSVEACDDVLGATPRMSDAARNFVHEVLAVNKERLCDVQI